MANLNTSTAHANSEARKCTLGKAFNRSPWHMRTSKDIGNSLTNYLGVWHVQRLMLKSVKRCPGFLPWISLNCLDGRPCILAPFCCGKFRTGSNHEPIPPNDNRLSLDTYTVQSLNGNGTHVTPIRFPLLCTEECVSCRFYSG